MVLFWYSASRSYHACGFLGKFVAEGVADACEDVVEPTVEAGSGGQGVGQAEREQFGVGGVGKGVVDFVVVLVLLGRLPFGWETFLEEFGVERSGRRDGVHVRQVELLEDPVLEAAAPSWVVGSAGERKG
jgi:hypothetical protein